MVDPLLPIAAALLATIAVGGVLWVFLYPRLSGDATMEARRERFVSETGKVARRADVRGQPNDMAAKRKQIEEQLKVIEERNKRVSSNPPLAVRIEQAGLEWTRNTFIVACIVCGAVAFVVGLGVSGNALIALAFGFAAAFGAPRWYLNMRRTSRLKKFVMELPNAVDVIVRGVKAGLPLADCMRICARESSEPVRTEFRKIIETSQLGVTLAEATEKLYERVPVPEANFFAIVVTMQQKSGGNLSEILGNLSKVLRDRKKMKAKIKSMSAEATSSAAIIGCLPIAVMLLVYLSTPHYIEILWTHPTGQFLLMLSAGWMTCGVLVMRKMINFDF